MTSPTSATTTKHMNTGTQRSSATPGLPAPPTTPCRCGERGQKQNQKDLTQIVVAHGSPYVAQTTFLGNFKDFHERAHKAIYTEGPTFVNVLCPCPRGWQYSAELLPEICRLAVDTCIWPLYEVENGEYHLTYMPKKKLPVEEFMKLQGRFRHCFKPGNEWTIEAAQNYVDEKWEALLAKCQVKSTKIKQRPPGLKPGGLASCRFRMRNLCCFLSLT